jgi:peptidyl-prolyl cis-trans isomerase SurA
MRSFGSLLRVAAMLLTAITVVLPLGMAAGAETVDRIVAVVNGEIIVLSEVRQISQNYMKQMSEQFKVEAGDEQYREAERRILDQLIDEKLVNQEADRLTITIGEREIDAAVKEMQNRNKLNDSQFAAVLAEEGLTMQKYREQLKGQMKKVRVIDQEIKSRIQVPKEEIDAYYEKHAADFNAEPEVRIQQIRLIIPPESSEKDISRIQAQAESILAKIKKGEDFASLAGLYSQDPSASAGGDMGVFKRGELLPAIDEYAFGMKPGEAGGGEPGYQDRRRLSHCKGSGEAGAVCPDRRRAQGGSEGCALQPESRGIVQGVDRQAAQEGVH